MDQVGAAAGRASSPFEAASVTTPPPDYAGASPALRPGTLRTGWKCRVCPSQPRRRCRSHPQRPQRGRRSGAPPGRGPLRDTLLPPPAWKVRFAPAGRTRRRHVSGMSLRVGLPGRRLETTSRTACKQRSLPFSWAKNVLLGREGSNNQPFPWDGVCRPFRPVEAVEQGAADFVPFSSITATASSLLMAVRPVPPLSVYVSRACRRSLASPR